MLIIRPILPLDGLELGTRGRPSSFRWPYDIVLMAGLVVFIHPLCHSGGDFVLGEQIAGAEAQLRRVAHRAHSQGLLRPEFFNNGVQISPAFSGEAGALKVPQVHDRPQGSSTLQELRSIGLRQSPHFRSNKTEFITPPPQPALFSCAEFDTRR